MTARCLALLLFALTVGVTGCASSPTQGSVDAGEPASSPLYQAIAARDADLGRAFDAHDLDALMALFTDDLEFYHDLGGLQRNADVRRGFGGLFAQGNGIRRELVPGTLRVFPIKGHGAIELGQHRFCHLERGKEDCGTFEFLHVWRQEGGAWRIARVVSYGH